jgi:hypothetical protein
MKCNYAQSYFDRIYREGETFERSDILDHISHCKQCHNAYIQWRRIACRLEDAPPLDAPPYLYHKVMLAIDEQKCAQEKWRWLPQWRLLPVPAAIFALLILSIIGMVTVLQQPVTRQQITLEQYEAPSPKEPRIPATHFKIADATARTVALVGDFNGWDTQKHQLVKQDDGIWTIDIELPKGCYQYLFYIDGNAWKTDPNRQQRIPDGFGGYNTVIEL